MRPRIRIADRYEVLGRLGLGGMAVVHRVRDRGSGRVLAMKQPRWRGLGDWEPRLDPRLSLEREYRVLSSLDHPHVVRALEFGFDEAGEPFLLLELLEDARAVVSYASMATRPQRFRVLVELFEALAYLHQHGLLHRDIKPSNVLVCRTVPARGRPAPGARVCLIDFGLACPSGEDAGETAEASSIPISLVGSVIYLAPELALGQPATTASDMYAAGMIAAQVLAGIDPMKQAGPRATLAALRDCPRQWLGMAADSLGIDSKTVALLGRLLARDPNQRCSADEAVRHLRRMEERFG